MTNLNQYSKNCMYKEITADKIERMPTTIGPESLVFLFAIQNNEDQNIQCYNLFFFLMGGDENLFLH